MIQKRKKWLNFSDEFKRDMEDIYKDINVCPECSGDGYRTVVVSTDEGGTSRYELKRKCCARCFGDGLYIAAM
ncbi:MAG: hypothetical protein H6Q74_2604 [Firmicutes bacterium]|nr:hypothetical protein [Bacillota bacterium]